MSTLLCNLVFLCSLPSFVSSASFAQAHPQQHIFGQEFDLIWVGTNPNASVRMINPNLSKDVFGYFSVPSPAQFLVGNYNGNLLKTLFGISKDYSENLRQEFVPPETARGLLLHPSTHPVYRDILVKGTGTVDKFTENNQLRYAHLGFDGNFEVSEAVRDLVTSEILDQAGALVSRGIVIIDHNKLVQRNGLPSPLRMGNYVRAFRVQTRLSNLANLLPVDRKRAIDDAILQLQTIRHASRPMSYVEYYHYILEKLAQNAAIYQATGYTQDSLHYGQVTLAGEMTDLGVGTFDRPTGPGEINTKYAWFRYERQPMLIQNMLYKTHSVKSEPQPVELDPESETVRNQKTLFSYIQSFDPDAARKIESMNPLKMFWEAYTQYYGNFDTNRFKRNVLDKVSKIYNWSPTQVISTLPASKRDAVLADYQTVFNDYAAGLERPNRSGPALQVTNLEKQRLFIRALRRNGVSIEGFSGRFSTDDWGINGERDSYIEYSTRNPVPDLSWKPKDVESFIVKKLGAHPLSHFVKSGNRRLESGQKIIWMTDSGVSPFAVIRSVRGISHWISFEHPISGEIVDQVVSYNDLLKLNDPNKSIQIGDIVSGTKVNLGNRLKARLAELRKRTQPLALGPSDSPDTIKEKQMFVLNEIVSSAYTDYVSNLDEDKNAIYEERNRKRLDQGTTFSLEWSMVEGCGNCMDQNLFTSGIVSEIADDFQLKYSAYVARNEKGQHHFFTAVTLLPSQDQYILESSYPGIRLLSLRQAYVFSRFPITNIVDQHKPSDRRAVRSCQELIARDLPIHQKLMVRDSVSRPL